MAVLTTTVPSMEPIRAAVNWAVANVLPGAIADVAARNPQYNAALTAPAAVILGRYVSPALIQAWPTLVVLTYDLRVDAPTQQLIGMRWVGTVEVQYYVHDDDPNRLAIALDRYAEAIGAMLIGSDPLAGVGWIRPETFQVGWGNPEQETTTDRVVGVRCDVQLESV